MFSVLKLPEIFLKFNFYGKQKGYLYDIMENKKSAFKSAA